MGGLTRWTTTLALLSFDALFLAILAVGTAYQAEALHRLRREVADARRLGPYLPQGAARRRRHGRGLPGRAPAPEAPLRRQADPARGRGDPGARARFEREVQITAALTHPNIVEVYDYGQAEDGTFYYVMEYLPGLTLEQLVERHGPLPPGRAVHLLRQVCRALRWPTPRA